LPRKTRSAGGSKCSASAIEATQPAKRIRRSISIENEGKKVNKSFRSVWSEALGVWVAVSEVCTARGKKSSSITIGAGLLATAAFGK
jgi:hypothetical protein